MKNLTESQKKKLIAMAEIADKGDLAVVQKIFDLQDTFESTTEEIKTVQDNLSLEVQKVAEIRLQTPQKGDDGKDYVLTDTDKKQIAASIKVPIIEKIIERTEIIREQPLVTQITNTTNEIKEVAVTDSPDQVVEKVNSSNLLIKKERIEGLLDLMMNIAANATASVGITTTHFFKNGGFVGRAKNVNFIEGTGTTLTMNQTGDQVNVTVSATGVGATILTTASTVNDSNVNFVFTKKPTLINVNGTFYRESNGWSWNSGTLTATLDSPVGLGGDIYALA